MPPCPLRAAANTQDGARPEERLDKLIAKEKDLLRSWAEVVRVVPASLTDNE
jgi:hypothetical protein